VKKRIQSNRPFQGPCGGLSRFALFLGWPVCHGFFEIFEILLGFQLDSRVCDLAIKSYGNNIEAGPAQVYF
jgi:hypothetical protein